MQKAFSFIPLLFLLCFVSCSSDKDKEKAQQTAPSPQETSATPPEGSGPSSLPASGELSLKITPESGTRQSTFFAIALGFDIGSAKIEWLVNGMPVQIPSPNQFKAEETKKGAKIQVRATINGREIVSPAITIKNSPPEITDARIAVESRSAISAEATARDADGDEVALQYNWTVNLTPAGNERRLSRPFKQGDNVTVKIVPYDGEDYGRPVVLQKIFGNMPPVVQTDRMPAFDGKLYTYQISASDPDGDTLTYTLKSGPSGMTVDSSTGLVRWEVPKDFVGKAPATVVVSDGHGGETVYQFNAGISREK